MKKLSNNIKIYYQDTKDKKNYYFDINDIIKRRYIYECKKEDKKKGRSYDLIAFKLYINGIQEN